MVSLHNGNGEEVQLYYKVTSPLIHLSFKWQEFDGRVTFTQVCLGSATTKPLTQRWALSLLVLKPFVN